MSGGWTLLDVTASDGAALWRDALEGDERAFGELFRLHRDAAFRQALRFCSEAADAEEVAAAAFFELWRHRHRVRVVEGSVLPWLLVTVANLGRNGLRGSLRREALLRRLVADHDRSAVPSYDQIDVLGLRLEVRAALRRLPALDAMLVTMTALEGYSSVEAAAALGIAEGSARMRLHRARVRLRPLLTGLTSSPLFWKEPTP